MSLEQNGFTIYNILIQVPGATKAAVCGILGNNQQENSMSPADNRGGLGICQWTNSGGRRRTVINWCKAHGYNYLSVEGQARYIAYDLQTSSYYNRMWRVMCSYPNTAQGAADAAEYFEKIYEKAGIPNNENRRKYAKQWFSRISGGGGSVYSEGTQAEFVKDPIYYAQQEIGHHGGYKYAGSGASWCQYFAAWCAKQAGSDEPDTGSTSYGMDWFKERGRFRTRDSGYVPQRNDLVYYKTGASHVGRVEYWDGNALHTIEGNYSNQVKRRTVPPSKSPGWSNITGYGLVHDYIKNSGGADSGEGDGTSSDVPITKVSLIEDEKTRGKWTNANAGHPAYITSGVELTIANDKFYNPAVVDDIQLEQTRKPTPSKLTFSVLKDSSINFKEGNPVTLRYNGYGIFSGYIFSKERSDGDQIKVTAYDQMRYLKSKDTMAYSNVTATGLLKQMAKDYQLTVGDCDETGKVLPNAIKEATLLDIMGDAIDQTVLDTGKLYVLWDDFGKLRLSNIQSLTTNLLIDDTQAESFSYQTSIDDEAYSRIAIAWDDKSSGTRYVKVVNNTERQSEWGVLTYYEKLDSDSDWASVEGKAKILEEYYGKLKRSLSYTGVFGNPKIHAGCSVIVKQTIGDIEISNYMVCENVTHHFKNDDYTMDLKLSGVRGEFSA